MDADLNKVADAYLRRREEDFWAWEEVHSMIEADLDQGWNMTLLLLTKAKSEDDLGYVAAGPMGDLIDLYGHKALDLIEAACKNNPRVPIALSTVGVQFYYEEFDRWYDLLCMYGFRDRVIPDGQDLTGKVVRLMKSFLNQNVGALGYTTAMEALLDGINTPLADKKARKILQSAFRDAVESMREPDLRARVKQSLAHLESLSRCPQP